MKKLIFLLIVVLLFISIGAVSAEGNFTSLKNDIDSNPKSVDLTQDYVYDNNTDEMRVIADHIRGAYLLAAQGLAPSNFKKS